MNKNPYLYADDRRIYLQDVNTETANREEIARMQSQTQDLRHEMMMAELSACLNHGCRMEEEPVLRMMKDVRDRFNDMGCFEKEYRV